MFLEAPLRDQAIGREVCPSSSLETIRFLILRGKQLDLTAVKGEGNQATSVPLGSVALGRTPEAEE